MGHPTATSFGMPSSGFMKKRAIISTALFLESELRRKLGALKLSAKLFSRCRPPANKSLFLQLNFFLFHIAPAGPPFSAKMDQSLNLRPMRFSDVHQQPISIDPRMVRTHRLCAPRRHSCAGRAVADQQKHLVGWHQSRPLSQARKVRPEDHGVAG